MSSIYAVLSRINFLSGNYALKFLLIAFLGIHIPLIGIIVILVTGHSSGTAVFITALVCTLVACGLTLYLLHALLDPLRKTSAALNNYVHKKEMPALPLQYHDEAGKLMQQVQSLIEELDSLKK